MQQVLNNDNGHASALRQSSTLKECFNVPWFFLYKSWPNICPWVDLSRAYTCPQYLHVVIRPSILYQNGSRLNAFASLWVEGDDPIYIYASIFEWKSLCFRLIIMQTTTFGKSFSPKENSGERVRAILVPVGKIRSICMPNRYWILAS
jgi:hypothetical protein